jgi:hypothetical protein
MATTNRFQTRVLIPDKSSLTNNEIRLNSLLTQAQTYLQTLDDLQTIENNQNLTRQTQLDQWSSKMFEKIDDLYQISFTDLRQSLEQLKLFQQMMINILNNDQENYLDGKKLSAIEHEICILKCLTYQLDTTKVKIEGKLKLRQVSEDNQNDISIDDDDNEENNEMKFNEKKEKKDFICRILVHHDSIEKIENLPLFQEFVQITTNQTTPERVLTINGKDFSKNLFDFKFNFCS